MLRVKGALEIPFSPHWVPEYVKVQIRYYELYTASLLFRFQVLVHLLRTITMTIGLGNETEGIKKTNH